MAEPFVCSQEKASWGIPCNQRSDGELFVGKGSGTSFENQFDMITARVAKCLADNRGDRNGRFWVNTGAQTVTMAVGESSENKYLTQRF